MRSKVGTGGPANGWVDAGQACTGGDGNQGRGAEGQVGGHEQAGGRVSACVTSKQREWRGRTMEGTQPSEGESGGQATKEIDGASTHGEIRDRERQEDEEQPMGRGCGR